MSRSPRAVGRYVNANGDLVEVVADADGVREIVRPADEAIARLEARNAEIRARLDALVDRWPALKSRRRP